MGNWYGEEFNPVNPLDWLAGAGYVADTPYSMVRNVLAGQDVTKGLLNPQERTTGRQLLEHWGAVDQNEDGVDAGDVAGFAVDMLDPISMAAGLYAPKMLKAAKLARAAKQANAAKTLATMGMEETPEIAEFAAKLRAAEKAAPIMSESRSLVPMFSDVMKPVVEQAADKIDELPKSIPLPGWKYAEKPFYSRLEKAAERLPDNVKAVSLRNMLSKAPEGVSKEEMDWVLKGLPESGVLTKDQVLKHVNNNGLKIELKELGDTGMSIAGTREMIENESPEWMNFLGRHNAADAYQAGEIDNETLSGLARKFLSEARTSTAKWPQYVVPGGSDYKEILIKLPRNPTKNELYDQASNIRHDLRNDVAPHEMREEMRNRAAELEQKAESLRGPQNYKSAHWDEPNVLAHARFDTRDINGEKTLFVNEIQSDWHQDGRKFGYVGDVDKKLHISEKISPRGISSFQVLDNRGNVVASGLNRETAESYVNAYPGTVPDAPLKDDEWAKLTLKHLLEYATQNGYDRLAFANGKQAAKYAAGGASGNTAKGIARWYDETLPTIMAKLLKKEKVGLEPVHINEDVVASFRIPRETKTRIQRYGQPLLSLVPPLAAGYALSQQKET